MKRLLTILFTLLFSYSQAQEPWLFENYFDKGFQILESYDGGTIILANKTWQSYNGKIIKLDKAGDILWEHSIEEGDEGLDPFTLVEDKQGNLYIGGRTFQYEEYGGDGFLMKLNACGILQWFRKIHFTDESDNVQKLILGENGNLYFNHHVGLPDMRFNLTKVDSLGNILWNQTHLAGEDSLVWASNLKDLIRTSDKGFLMIGSAYAVPYFDQNTTIGYIRSAVVKTDSLGNEEWHYIYRWEEDEPENIILSTSANIDELANGHLIVTALDRNDSYIKVMLYELDENGELVWSKNISKPNTAYDKTRSCIANDSTLLVCTAASLPSNELYRHIEVYKLDLQGNILAEYVDDNNSLISRDFRLTNDSSGVYILPAAKSEGSYNLYALKLNPYTMELDTFVTEDNTVYDYYCPEGVEEQSIYFPEEFFTLNESEQTKPQLKIAPNPARNFTYLYFDIKDFNRSAKLEIYNMQGALMKSYPLQAAIGRVHEDLGSYSNGVYIVSLIVNDRLVESSKMVVE